MAAATASVLGVPSPPGCELRPASGKGNGLFASSAWEPGAHVWSEEPLFAMQHTENRRVVAACAHCCSFAGGVSAQLDALFRGAYTQHLFGEAHFEPLLAAAADYVPKWDAEIGGRHPVKAVVRCAQGCGELYCSAACRDAHFAHSHNLLCVGPIEEEDHPLLRFKLHALEKTDTLLLAAQVLANLANRARAEGGGAAAVRALVSELRVLCHAPFPEVCRLPRGRARNAEFVAHTEGWIGEAASLLRAALAERAPAEAAALFERGPALLSEVMGLFERNNVTVEVASPLAPFFADRARTLAASSPGDARAAAELEVVERLLRGKEELMRRARGGATTGICDEEEAVEPCAASRDPDKVAAEVGRMGLGELLEAAWPAVYGDALSVSAARTNHSCAPNLKLKFLDGGARLTAVALRPVAAGEELCYSYVSEAAGTKARRRQLLHWGFTCGCERCSQEDAGPPRKVRRQRLK